MGINKRLFIPQDSGITGTDYFDFKNYTGPSTTISGLSFQPDLALLIATSDTDGNHIIDSVRGVKKTLFPNLIQSELDRNSVTAFNSDGVTLGDYASLNHTGTGYFWKAGGTASTNSDGAVNINLSASAESGFSIGTRTGKQETADTVAHGLGKSPEMIIMRARNVDSEWLVWFPSINSTNYLNLRALDGFAYNASYYQPTVTSTTFTTNWTNSSYQWIYYFFASIDGYQKFGSYSGNGTSKSVTGLGFQPRWVMIKRTDTDGNWQVWDSTRNPSADNSNNNVVYINTNLGAIDAGSGVHLSFDSDGFTINGASGNNNNGSAPGNYIYWAIA